MTANYSEDTIRTLDWKEHIRKRPGMYIGKLGDGSSPDDGIYILLKEVIDNCIDEYMMGFGKTIDVSINEHRVSVRDYGRGVPLGKVPNTIPRFSRNPWDSTGSALKRSMRSPPVSPSSRYGKEKKKWWTSVKEKS